MSTEDSFYLHHLKPTKVENRELFYSASLDIEHSFSGRLDMFGLHTFFSEASMLIRNALRLYEEGFFDSAFYSVRSALELSRIVTYFSDIDNPQESEIFKSWASGSKFPFDREIKREIEKSSSVYQELHEVMGDFFGLQAERLRAAQKYIHKQGFKAFYARGGTNAEREKLRQDRMNRDFESFVKNSIVEIALLRLCIDPFPLLLNDPDIMYKVHFESMTEPFSDDMIEKILGNEIVSLYRSTEFYKSHVAYFESNVALSEEAHELLNNQYYNRSSWHIIKQQLQLLSAHDQAAVRIFNSSSAISKIYIFRGLVFYFSDVKSNRTKFGFSSTDFDQIKVAEVKINTDYDGAYLSYISGGDEDYWLEHNALLNPDEIIKIQKAAM
jgi:hypothetical protein